MGRKPTEGPLDDGEPLPVERLMADPDSRYRIAGKPGLWFNGFQVYTWSSRLSIHDKRYVYFIEFQEMMVKVGLADDVDRRMEEFRLGCPRGLVLRGKWQVPACFARQIEKRIHIALDEWADGREWFNMRAEDAKVIAAPIIRAARVAHRLAHDHGVRFGADSRPYAA